MHVIPSSLGCRASLSVGREVGALCVECLVVFVPSLPHPFAFLLCISVTGARLIKGVGAHVSISELVANSGSSRLSRAANLHSLSYGDEVV